MTPVPDVDAGVVRYAEPARSYRSLAYSTLGIAIGFGVDLLFSVSGAVAHLPGWLIFGAIIVGAHALILYAVRATHSLRLTDAELWIGDEVLTRDDIVGVTDPSVVADEDVPVLGWPNGVPRGVSAIVVRLDDGRDVVVPTRFPGRLQDALGVGASTVRAEAPVREAGPGDLALLADIDARAGTIFRVAGYALPPIPWDEQATAAARAVFVVDDPPVGFVVLDELDGVGYVRELAVLPHAMRGGLGTRLLEAGCAWASAAGYPAITLTTFVDVRWNAPFYRARGFAELAELPAGLAAQRDRERRLGLDAVGPRIAMRREL